ncbi:MAG: hypothetical protein ACTHNY_06250 [Solirubrobacterales bacterium]
MFEPDDTFAELIEAFEEPEDHPGWTIGSAEGGWVIPSEKDWGQPEATKGAEVAPAQAAQ